MPGPILGSVHRMTTPVTPVTRTPVVVGAWTLNRVLLFIAAVLFVLAAFAAGGDPLGGITAWSWGFGAFSAWMLSGAL